MTGIDFAAFKAGPGGVMARALGIGVDGCSTWRQFMSAAIAFNDSQLGVLVDRARHLDGVVSSGQRPLLQAILHAVDFSWLADELGAGKTWRQLEVPDSDYRAAIAACVVQVD